MKNKLKWLFENGYLKKSKPLLKIKQENCISPKTLKQIARGNTKVDDKDQDKKLAKKLINPQYFTDEVLKIGFKSNLDGHSINHANSLLNIILVCPDFGIETRYNNKILRDMAMIYAKWINLYKFKNLLSFSASFHKINEEDERSVEIELFINLNIIQNLSETDIDNIDNKSQLDCQIQIQETKESGWFSDKISSMKIRFYKKAKLIGSSYVKILLRSNALIIIKKDHKDCFIWSILASFHPCDIDHPKRISNYGQYSHELNIKGFDFTNGFKCSDVHEFEKMNNLSFNKYELNFCQDKATGNII